METTPSTSDGYRTSEHDTHESYHPGTFQFSRGPGRIERFLRRLVRNRDVLVRPPTGVAPEKTALPVAPQVRPGAR